MKVKIEFSTDNAAFADDLEHELQHIAGQIAHKARVLLSDAALARFLKLYDSNGNSVGEVRVVGRNRRHDAVGRESEE